MTNRLINLLLLALVLGLLACDSPVSEKPEQISSSAQDVSSSSYLVSSSSEMNSSSSDAGTSSSSTTLKTEIARQILMTQSCDVWGMKDLDTSWHKASWSNIPDLRHQTVLNCALKDSLECEFGGVGSDYIFMEYGANAIFNIRISIYPINLDLKLDTTIIITDTSVQANYNNNDSLYHFELSQNAMRYSVEVSGKKKSYYVRKDTDSSWLYKIGNLSSTGYQINKLNVEGDTVLYNYNRFVSDSTGRVTIISNSSLLDRRVNFLEVNDTLRYVYWYGYAAQARECSNWNGDQIRFH